jgi:dual specificity tyrosine-phosphorylation-regulated kinase 2/3/4
MIEAGILEKLK